MAINATSLLGLVPTVMYTRNAEIGDALEMYHNDLP